MLNHQQNRLAREKSPYLLQHKDNPVDWYPWGDEAFEKARRERKLIFLSIGYSTCYWCHMMEKDSFERPEVAEALNRDFVSIKVDREEHPDVDQIYMDAVIGMTGHGGWPMSVFLTPDLKPFFGGTFFWRDPFLQILGRLQSAWQKEPTKVESAGEELFAYLQRRSQTAEPKELHVELLREAYRELEQGFDPTHGGFGRAPKFPHSMGISLLLRIYRRTGKPEALKMVEKTLEGMARGEIYDRIGGGFHRYSTRDDWNEPHYEKMLYDNALLVWNYLEAFQLTKNEMYTTVARQTLDYILREMTHPEGGFYSAQDAGEVGKEGEYYHLGKEQRARHEPPDKDDKILTSWNGLMIAAMAKGFQVLQEKRYLTAAQVAARFIREHLYASGPQPLLRRYRAGESKYPGTLDDYAFLIHGLLTLYESDFNPEGLHWARELQETQDRLFWDEKGAGYFFSPPGDDSLILRKKETHDSSIPSGNGLSALNLLRLHGLTYEESFRTRADQLLAFLSGELSQYPGGYAQALIAIDYQLDRSKEIALVGDPGERSFQDSLQLLHHTFLPNKVLAAGLKGEIPLLQGKLAQGGKTTFYICEDRTCRFPTTDPQKALSLLKEVERFDL